MFDYEIQKKETVSPTKAPEIDFLMGLGNQNQQKINQKLDTNTQ